MSSTAAAEQFVHRATDLVLGLLHAGRLKSATILRDDIIVASFGQIGRHDFREIGPRPYGRASRRPRPPDVCFGAHGLEFPVLVMRKLFSKPSSRLSKVVIVVPQSSPEPMVEPPADIAIRPSDSLVKTVDLASDDRFGPG